MAIKINKYQAATAIAVFFHAVGLAGILFFDKDFFTSLTLFNLLLSFLLLCWTQDKINIPFLVFFLLVFGIGFGVEVIGVNTRLLFGDYSYGNVLGIKWLQVPMLIGINWFIIIYCCGISVHTLLMKAINRVALDSKEPPAALKALSIIVDGASLAVIFDWLMEPVAIKLGFWTWNGDIPLYNYISWFMVSMLLLSFFHFLSFSKQNKFAINLLLIQGMFFLILRSFLP
ncbi:MAG: carotenoid biosynthesis protein [Ferruginibacter sp.]